MKTTPLLSRLALTALLAAVLTGCPKVPDADPLEPSPAVLSFTASAAVVPLGTSIKLTWAVENASEVKIDELQLGSVSGVSGNAGEVDVAITADSLFVLTARNARGASDTAVVAVRVGGAAGELLFTALPGAIEAGQPATLAWSAPGATAITLTATPGGAVDVGTQTSSGSVVVSPTTTTVYTLTAGTRTATATVAVRPTLLSFTASSLSADAGSTVTLAWTTANATRVQLSAPGRGTLVDETTAAGVAAGSFDDVLPTEVDPGQLFAYQLTVTGAGATLTDSLVVSINGNPAVVSFDAPKYVKAVTDGGVLTLAWVTREADEVSITAGGAEFYRAPANAVASGSTQVPVPGADTTYELTALNTRGGRATKTAVVDLVGPPTVSLVATPSTIAAGDPITLTWAGTDVRNVRISSPIDGVIFSASDTADTGALPNPVSFPRDVVLRIDVDNGAGDTAFATAAITVTGGLQFSVPPGSIRAGELVTVSWTPATATLTGLPHDEVVVRAGSTGFDDISTTGTQVTFSGGDAAAKFEPVGFSAPFFGRLVGSEVWIAADGYLSFNPVGNYAYSSVALPSSKIEPYSIAPCWADASGTVGRWQVKSVTGGNVLIVQWNAAYQVKVFSSGQIDVEYKAPGTCTNRGVRGPFGDVGFPFAATPAADLGLTLFGPKTGSATIPFRHELPVLATIELAGRAAPLRQDFGPVVRPNELSVSEALPSPLATLGAPGQWFELFNARSTPVDLTGWSVRVTDGGVAGALSGVVPPRGVLVVGATTDGALNDDAGVQLALAGFDPGVDAGTVGLGRNGDLSTFVWADASPGVAIVTDFGPYRFSTDTSTSVARPQVCAPTTSFGAQLQLGTPGVAQGCGFPYVWQEIPGGFFDISTTGTRAVITDPLYDEATVALPLTAAPFPFFGAPQASASVSTNGFVSFDGTGANSTFADNFPSTTTVNSVLAPFTGNLVGYWLDSEIYSQRVGANVDPAAAAPHWIIQWFHWSHYSTYTDFFSVGGDDLNFQVKLFDDGAIEYHYGRMASGSSARSATGIRTVTWLENPTGTQALVLNTRSFQPGISSHTAFRFVPR